MKRCPACGGAGETVTYTPSWDDPGERRIECGTCRGDGQVQDSYRRNRGREFDTQLSRAKTRTYDR